MHFLLVLGEYQSVNNASEGEVSPVKECGCPNDVYGTMCGSNSYVRCEKTSLPKNSIYQCDRGTLKHLGDCEWKCEIEETSELPDGSAKQGDYCKGTFSYIYYVHLLN